MNLFFATRQNILSIPPALLHMVSATPQIFGAASLHPGILDSAHRSLIILSSMVLLSSKLHIVLSTSISFVWAREEAVMQRKRTTTLPRFAIMLRCQRRCQHNLNLQVA